MNYPIPRASAQAWQHYRQSASPVTNAGLIFDRFVSPEQADRREVLVSVKHAATKADRQLLAAWQKRWEAAARAAQADVFTLQTDWRFVTGLGRKGPLETGFTFHRYGFPYLPGSSVKGVARAWALLGAGLAEDHPDVLVVFGCVPPQGKREPAARCGHAIFLDAIPAAVPTLDLDIMNPHYRDYYQGNAPPTDCQSPVPITFLTVAARTPFRFAVGWRGEQNAEAERLHRLARQWLVEGLTQLGAGAKTSAGYGYFIPPTGIPQSISPVAPPPTTPQPQPAPAQPPPPVVIRRGEIVEIRPDKRTGKVKDDETGQTYRFSTAVIDGATPAKKSRVVFHLQDQTVVKVRRL